MYTLLTYLSNSLILTSHPTVTSCPPILRQVTPPNLAKSSDFISGLMISNFSTDDNAEFNNVTSDDNIEELLSTDKKFSKLVELELMNLTRRHVSYIYIYILKEHT